MTGAGLMSPLHWRLVVSSVAWERRRGVVAGLVPAIHVGTRAGFSEQFSACPSPRDVDARDKSGHDGRWVDETAALALGCFFCAASSLTTLSWQAKARGFATVVVCGHGVQFHRRGRRIS
jgi:hypothetical protein